MEYSPTGDFHSHCQHVFTCIAILLAQALWGLARMRQRVTGWLLSHLLHAVLHAGVAFVSGGQVAASSSGSGGTAGERARACVAPPHDGWSQHVANTAWAVAQLLAPVQRRCFRARNWQLMQALEAASLHGMGVGMAAGSCVHEGRAPQENLGHSSRPHAHVAVHVAASTAASTTGDAGDVEASDSIGQPSSNDGGDGGFGGEDGGTACVEGKQWAVCELVQVLHAFAVLGHKPHARWLAAHRRVMAAAWRSVRPGRRRLVLHAYRVIGGEHTFRAMLPGARSRRRA